MPSVQSSPISGVLLLYRLPTWQPNPPTISEHVDAFQRYSEFKVWTVNAAWGFPKGLERLRFRIIVLHYSANLDLSGTPFSRYLDESSSSYKIAFFQDEHHMCQRRFEFIDRYDIDCVYTLLEGPEFEDVYRKHTNVRKIVYNIPGYVSDEMVVAAQRYSIPGDQRRFDVRYRGRRLPFYMGNGAQEKHEIALGFKERSNGLGLKLDLEIDEEKRKNGDAWYRFLADSRAVLGVEAGVSIFDTTDEVREQHDRLLAETPDIGFEEMTEQLLAPWEDLVYYRTISPRHFEAAAFRVCQVLFEGKYSGIMQPMVHYIPLKKDFSNFDQVVRQLKDASLRHELTENAHRDLIASGKYSYERFIQSFDTELKTEGLTPEVAADEVHAATRSLRSGSVLRFASRIPYILLVYPYPGRHVRFRGRDRVERLFRSVLKHRS